MLRLLGIGLGVALLGVIGLWCAALGLPDAPSVSVGAKPPGIFIRFVQALRQRSAAPSDTPSAGVLAVPVAGIRRDTIRDSWGDPRDNGLRAHHGTDLMAPANTPVLAAAPGTVEKLWTSAAGGTTLYVRSPARNRVYYYAHLSGYAAGLHEGQIIAAGDPIGFVGDTGNAGAGNFHLHFGLTRTTPEQHWYQGEDVDPYPYLAGKPLPR